MIADVAKIFLPAVAAFVMGILISPPISDFLYQKRAWKKKAGKIDLSGNNTPLFNKLHEKKEVNTPRMGGVVIWLSAFLTVIIFWIVSYFLPTELSTKLDFLSRSQTWIPIFSLLIGSIVGFFDDLLEIRDVDIVSKGLSLKKRLLVVALVGLLTGSWFYFKLGIHSLGLPGGMEIPLGILFIPIFALVMIAVYSGGVIDGLDGLSGGIFATMFAAYAGIAFFQAQIDLAAFCLVLVGSILAFLWFNIPPARYYMSETGTMGLTITLSIIAFMTDKLGEGYGVIVLPIIALPLVVTTGSVIIQVLSKKFRGGKKVFLIAPLHHHFEAIGWPAYKVTMRYWIMGVVFAILGVILAIIG